MRQHWVRLSKSTNVEILVETRGVEPLSEMECNKHLRA